MNRRKLFLTVLMTILYSPVIPAAAQARRLSITQAVELARRQAPDAKAAQNTYRSAYWSYRSYRADMLPSLTLSSSPNLNRSINKVTMSDGTEHFVEQNMLNTDLSLNLSQNVPWTGGRFVLRSNLNRLDVLSNHSTSWSATPLSISYEQSLFGYNRLKWNRRTEPLRYRKARAEYVESMELVAVRAIDRFFSLVNAQSNLRAAEMNYANADTLYRIARGRYDIGTITENEMLQLELSKLNEETNLMNAQLSVDESMQQLRSYLGILDNEEIEVVLSDSVPAAEISVGEALMRAEEAHPDVMGWQLSRLSAQSRIAQAKANSGLKADIYLRFGLSKSSDQFAGVYQHPLDQQNASISLVLPILDWGKSKGERRMARSNKELTEVQLAQSQNDFERNVRQMVNQFNLQARRLNVARRSDETANRRSEVARRLYILGKSTVLDLNNSVSEKDSARRNYLNALYNYWSYYYTLRSLTLYDFERHCAITTDYDHLMEEESK